MNLLAIETSCDETAAAVIAETGDAARPWRIRSNVVASQAAIHREWGGVVPELASRQHVRDICGVYEARARAGVRSHRRHRRRRRDAGTRAGRIAARRRRIWEGARRGRAVIPIVPVHHLAGHIESLTLAHGELPLPAAVLVVSGGHTSLYLIAAARVAISLIGRTRDDAAGEAYDKVAKLLGLGYPGGPAIDRVARDGQRSRLRLSRCAADPCRSQCAARDRRRHSSAGHRTPGRLQLQRIEDGRPAPRSRRTGTIRTCAR